MQKLLWNNEEKAGMKNKTWRRGFVFVAASASHPSSIVTEGLFIVQSCYILLYLKTLFSSLYSVSPFFIFIFPVYQALFALKFIDSFLTNVVELIYDGGVLDPLDVD